MKLEVKDKQDLKERAEQSLEFFIRLVHPDRVLGHVHKELISWWTRPQAKTHQLVLLPRDHGKSAMLAYRVAWEITRRPEVRVIYMSATTGLAVKQLGFIKSILTSPIYSMIWPEMINESMAERTKWTESEIQIDHPRRKQENVRDSTVFTAGLTTVITGLHADIIVLDDVVIDDNARTKEGRDEVKERVSYFASIGGTEAQVWAVGTRYHLEDLYSTFLEANFDLLDEDGNPEAQEFLYEIFERQVEDRGDGNGNFLWPRQQRGDGKWFGFDQKILAKKKAQYFDLGKFRAQYYNNPNSEESSALKPDLFQYYDKKFLNNNNGFWFFKDRRLNVFAAIDLAFTTKKESDYTCIVIAGIDSAHNIYILDVERFKSGKLQDYFDAILRTYTKWGYRKLRAEIVAAQGMVVNSLKEDYIRPNGLAISIEEYSPPKKINKEERIQGILYPKYNNQQVWHYKGGGCELLEEELTNAKPKHDDIKDALSSVVEIMIPPSNTSMSLARKSTGNIIYNTRFGGISNFIGASIAITYLLSLSSFL